MAVITPYPVPPPRAAWGFRAPERMSAKAWGRAWAWAASTTPPAPRNTAAIRGTSSSLTRPMRPMPPRITAPAHRAVTAPTARGSKPKVASMAAAMELDCTRFPPPKEAPTQHTENRQPRARLCRPFSM